MQEFCYHCGKKLKGDESVCPECGKPTGNMPAGVQTNRAPVTKNKGSSKMGSTGMLVIVILLTVVIVAGLYFMTGNTDTQSNDVSLKYEWDYKFDNGETVNYDYTLIVKKADYESMMKSTIDRTGTTSSARYVNSDGKTIFAVSDYIVIDNYIKTLKSALEEKYKSTKPAAANDDLASFITCFTQKAIKYDYDEANNNTEYWRYPLETLYDKKGDCEDTAILNAALLAAKADDSSTVYTSGVFLLPEHAISAVKTDEVIKTYNNPIHRTYPADKTSETYYPIETATDSQTAIGELTDKYLGAYFHLYLGNTSEYYLQS